MCVFVRVCVCVCVCVCLFSRAIETDKLQHCGFNECTNMSTFISVILTVSSAHFGDRTASETSLYESVHVQSLPSANCTQVGLGCPLQYRTLLQLKELCGILVINHLLSTAIEPLSCLRHGTDERYDRAVVFHNHAITKPVLCARIVVEMGSHPTKLFLFNHITPFSTKGLEKSLCDFTGTIFAQYELSSPERLKPDTNNSLAFETTCLG